MEAKDVLTNLEVGDEITVSGYSQTFTVTNVMFGGEMVDIEGPRGGEKGLVQNVNSGAVRMTGDGENEGVVSEISVVGESVDDEDEEKTPYALNAYRSNPNQPMKTNADVYESAARVMVHDTGADNQTVRIHVEHAEHDGGVCSFLCFERSNVANRIQSHLDNLHSDLVSVDLVDDAGVGLTESALIDTPETTQSVTVESIT